MSRTMPPSSLSLARRNAGTAPARANTVAAFNVLKAEYAAAQAGRGGPSGTMLTGPQGVSPDALQLGRTTLLGM